MKLRQMASQVPDDGMLRFLLLNKLFSTPKQDFEQPGLVLLFKVD